MPIKIPDSLPARAILEDENIFVMTEHRAILQDIRPLELLILAEHVLALRAAAENDEQ